MNSTEERKAEQLLAKHGITAPPVPIAELAANEGILVTYEAFRPEMSGLLLREPGQRPVIGVNSRHHRRRQRFTIAHELGHYLLHKGQLIVDSGLRVDYRSDAQAHVASVADERSANAFAAALLMPQELVAAEVRATSQGQLSGRALASAVARTFDVSEEAMAYRLLNLGFSPLS